MVPVHAQTLDFAQLLQAVGGDDDAEDGAPGADAVEAKVGFLDEVFEVHAVERGDEGACCDGKGGDGEFEVQQHERVAVGVEDSADAGVVVSIFLRLEYGGNVHLFGVSDAAH